MHAHLLQRYTVFCALQEAQNPRTMCFIAGVAELVDATDSKPVVRKGVRVRLSPPAPQSTIPFLVVLYFEKRRGHVPRKKWERIKTHTDSVLKRLFGPAHITCPQLEAAEQDETIDWPKPVEMTSGGDIVYPTRKDYHPQENDDAVPTEEHLEDRAA